MDGFLVIVISMDLPLNYVSIHEQEKQEEEKKKRKEKSIKYDLPTPHAARPSSTHLPTNLYPLM